MDLESFDDVNSAGRRNRCSTCNLDPQILDEIHAGRSRSPRPVSFATIAKWLETVHKVRIQHSTIRAHFVAGHKR